MLAGGTSNITDSLLDPVLEAAEECPDECIVIDALSNTGPLARRW
jgi:ferredoxin